MVKRGEKQEAKEAERMELYRQGMTDGQIAKAQGLSLSAIMAWRHRSGLPANPPKPTEEPKVIPPITTEHITPETPPSPVCRNSTGAAEAGI